MNSLAKPLPSQRPSSRTECPARVCKPLTVGIVHDTPFRPKLQDVLCLLKLLLGGPSRFAYTAMEGFAKPLRRFDTEPFKGRLKVRLGAAAKNVWNASWLLAKLFSPISQEQPRRDLDGALLRMSLFLSNEGNGHRVLILLGSCTHTGPDRPKPTLPSNVRVVAVGPDPNAAEPSQNTIRAVSIAEALKESRRDK